MKKTAGRIDAAAYEVLAAAYAKAGTEVCQEAVGAYRTKTTRAGEFIYVSCYPLISPAASRAQKDRLEELRSGKASVAARGKYDRYNNKRRQERCEQLAHANFGRGDFHVTLTYEVEDWDRRSDRDPIDQRTREEAKRELTNWLARVRRRLRRYGCDLSKFKWLRVTVTKAGNNEGPRERPETHHHHVLLGGVPEELRGEIERLWPYGYCNADRLQPDDKGVAAVAQYIAKQEGSANGQHSRKEKSWSGSRNLKQPATTTSDSRISRRRVSQIAADVRRAGREIFEAVYPGYRTVEEPTVVLSDFCAGAYIRAKLRIKNRAAEGRGAA